MDTTRGRKIFFLLSKQGVVLQVRHRRVRRSLSLPSIGGFGLSI